jgi:L-ribulose-5-phosphate 3-epimerase
MNLRTPTRRQFLHATVAATAAQSVSQLARAQSKALLFKISLAEWSLHQTLGAKKLTNLDFPRVAKSEFGIAAVEYVNQFWMDKARDSAYVAELKRITEGEGITNVLIMCDREGDLGDPDESKRSQAVDNHKKWIEAAKALGCHSIRVNARSTGSYDEQMDRAADGLRKLSEFAKQPGLNVIVENHGGLSSNGAWLAATIKKVGLPNCGTLPDFGNFVIDKAKGEEYDRYRGVEELMPSAKGVSAKSHDFDAQGNETHTDYRRMMKIVLAANYHGFVGIEYEGKVLDEYAGIRATKKLLETVRDELSGEKK